MDIRCPTCDPERALKNALICAEFKVTKVVVSDPSKPELGTKDGYFCDECLQEAREDDKVEVIEESSD
jgi:hypothetical protein